MSMPPSPCSPDATAARAQATFERLDATLARVRARVDRPLTLGEKLLYGRLVDPDGQPLGPGEVLAVWPDRVVLQDVLGQTAFLQFALTGRARVAVPTTVHCDHLIRAADGAEPDLAAAIADNREVYAFLRTAAAKYGAGFWGPGSGIVHQVVLENYATPGQLVLGTDSHTPNGGGLTALAVGVGGAEAVEAMAGLPWELPTPRRIAVVLTGSLSGWASPKDVVLWVAARLGVRGGTHAILEYIGPGARSFGATGRATITNMGAELGATTSLFPADEATARYLTATGRADVAAVAARYPQLLAPDPAVEADPDRCYDQVLRLDLDALEPHLSGPHSPDRARPLSDVARELADPAGGLIDRISVALIGSCTNASYQDFARAADVAGQAAAHGVQAQATLFVTPGSERVRATVERDGLLGPLRAVGARVLANACGPCIGQWSRADGADAVPSTIVSSFNRNFPGRNDGRAVTHSYVASPELVAALALAGRLGFDPRRDALTAADGAPFVLTPPAQAPDVPPGGFADGRSAYVDPPEDGADVVLAIDPGSERLAPLAPWPAWDGRDVVGAPVLIKTAGKTTTDAISPAGPWLRYRGHLERFSDNLLSGATDAYTGERGITADARTGGRGPVSQIARAYRAGGVPWVIVGDWNYGEGSSREHAALSPRLLGGRAVIARSFARIHESNLKKQGLLALTFTDPADYDRVRAGDRVDLVGLDGLSPGVPVRCVLHHADGATTAVALAHSYTAAQVRWFVAGSALALSAR